MSTSTDFEIRFDETPRPADNEANTLYNEALMHISSDDFEEAADVLIRLINLTPSDKDAPTLLAKVYLEADRSIDALFVLVRALHGNVSVPTDLLGHVIAQSHRDKGAILDQLDEKAGLGHEVESLRKTR